VFPSSHYVTGRRKCCRRSSDQDRARTQKEFFVSQMKLIEAQRIEQRTRFDLEMMTEIGYCKGIENYSRYLSGASRRAAADAHRLPAEQCADVRRRSRT
jgi:excinuclease ABC subunit B